MSNLPPGGFRKFVCCLFVSLSGMVWIAPAGLAAEAIPAAAAIASVTPNRIGLGDTVVVSITGVKSAGAGEDAFVLQNLILYLDGRPLPDHKPSVVYADCQAQEKALAALRNATTEDQRKGLPQATKLVAECKDTVQLRYRLTRRGDDEESKIAWIALLGAPSKLMKKSILVQVGLVSGETVPTGPDAESNVKFDVVPFWRLIIAISIFVAALVIFLGFALRSRIIRDVAAPNLPQGSRAPFSLGRTQMAWWFFLVLGAYLFIAVITGNYETISAQALILIGIATGTGMGAMAIDFNKSGKAQENLTAADNELAALAGKLEALETELAHLSGPQAPSAADAARLVVLAVEIAEIPAKQAALTKNRAAAAAVLAGPATAGFGMDLVKDRRGVSFHRFQIVVWTVVLGLVFVTEVYQTLAMPEFSATLLSLMGITAGTYLGFKFPEQKS